MDQDSKYCLSCKQYKNLGEFRKDRSRSDGFQPKCAECVREYNRAYYEKNKAAVNQRNKANRHRYVETAKASRAEWEKANKAWRKEWRSRNKHKLAEYQRATRAKHPHKHVELSARRRAAIRKQPVWSDAERVQEIYARAQLLREQTGDDYQVDHIVPLVSRLVSGLHVHTNLRIVKKAANQSKGNRTWPDMPGT